MWVKAWTFKWHNPNLKTGAWPRRGSDHVSESNMGTGMERTMSVPPSCSQASILGTDAAGVQLLVVPRALCWSPLPEPAAPLLFPGQKFGPLNPHSKFTPTPVHLHPFSQYIWKLTVIYSKASPIPHTQDPHYSCPMSPTPLFPQHLPVLLLTHNTLSLLHLRSLQPPLSSARLPTPYLRSTTAAGLLTVPPMLTFLLILQLLLPLAQAQTSASFHSHPSSHFPWTWHMEGLKARMLPTLAWSLPRSTLKQLKIRCTQEE